jgi:hypothetical protein
MNSTLGFLVSAARSGISEERKRMRKARGFIGMQKFGPAFDLRASF